MENILNTNILDDIPTRPLKPVVFADVFNNMELTIELPDGHIETFKIQHNQIGGVYNWNSFKELIDYQLSGDNFLLHQSLKTDFPSLWKDLTKGLGQNGITITNAWYMEL